MLKLAILFKFRSPCTEHHLAIGLSCYVNEFLSIRRRKIAFADV